MTIFNNGTVSLTTLSERVRCPLVLPDEPDGYQYRFLDDDSWELTESTLTRREGDYYLHLGFRQPAPTKPENPADRTVLGVDFGIANLAVTSTAQFFSGDELAHKHREFERRRQALQENGSRSALRTLKRLSRHERRYTEDLLHRISAAIVDEARKHDCAAIVLEDLTDIRDELPDARQFHVWAFRQLTEFVEYKSETEGIAVATVDPSYTSQRCSQIGCGHIAEENRSSQEKFHCQACGYEANADYNAAKNIGLKYVRCGPQSPQRTGTGQCALKSGTLSPTEGYTDKSSALDDS